MFGVVICILLWCSVGFVLLHPIAAASRFKQCPPRQYSYVNNTTNTTSNNQNQPQIHNHNKNSQPAIRTRASNSSISRILPCQIPSSTNLHCSIFVKCSYLFSCHGFLSFMSFLLHHFHYQYWINVFQLLQQLLQLPINNNGGSSSFNQWKLNNKSVN